MAINEKPDKAARNVGYLAGTGGGKSQALYQNPSIPKRGAFILMWDTNKDHKSTRFSDRKSFLSAVKKAVLSRQKGSKKSVRLSFTTKIDSFDKKEFIAEFEWFCKVVWAALDGNYDTYIFLEELAACSESASKASPALGIIMTQGRKYGAIVHYTTQRPAGISKDVYTQTNSYLVGMLKVGDKKRVMNECGIPKDVIMPSVPLEFLYTDTMNPPERINLTYKNPHPK
jgi:hypothetical protein